MTTNKHSKFLDYLRQCGATVLPVTNGYEIARFIAQGKTCVVYQDKWGRTSANGFALDCWQAFESGKRIAMGAPVKPRTYIAKHKLALLERDGDLCFFCAQPLVEDITVEHLVSHDKGGPDVSDNFALAHESCNKSADNLPLMKKIKMHIAALMAN